MALKPAVQSDVIMEIQGINFPFETCSETGWEIQESDEYYNPDTQMIGTVAGNPKYTELTIGGVFFLNENKEISPELTALKRLAESPKAKDGSLVMSKSVGQNYVETFLGCRIMGYSHAAGDRKGTDVVRIELKVTYDRLK